MHALLNMFVLVCMCWYAKMFAPKKPKVFHKNGNSIKIRL